MIRVFVAAPSTALRLALRSRLEGPGLAVVGDGPTPDGAPADADVVVIAHAERLPVSADALAEIGTRAVVAIADDERPARTLRGLPLRGWALVTRDASAAELRAATAAAAQGFTVVPASLAARLLPARLPPSEERLEERVEPLTPREREVLDLLAQGLTNRQIAERLGISEHTAKFHVAAVSAKLGAASRTEAVSRGVRRGLVTL
jgi:two-component system, NarL family, nitrate/nitrite response regulator NarL